MNIKVNILHSNLKVNGNELAFLFPLKFNAKRLKKDYGITCRYFQNITDNLYECVVLIVSSLLLLVMRLCCEKMVMKCVVFLQFK